MLVAPIWGLLFTLDTLHDFSATKSGSVLLEYQGDPKHK